MTAVIYARYSSDSQREASIEGQLRDCKDYAEKNGITVVGTYIDRAYSAKTDDRPNRAHKCRSPYDRQQLFAEFLLCCLANQSSASHADSRSNKRNAQRFP